MRNYQELFEELKDLQKGVCFVKGWCAEMILSEDQKYWKLENFAPDNYVQTVGLHSDEYILDAFKEFEFELSAIQKAGVYEFDAILSFSEEQTGEYGRTEVPAYLLIEHIEFKYQCSFEELNAIPDQDDNYPLFDF